MSFAENLKQIRKERNLSQEDLAELLDVSRQAVSKWEQGEGYPEAEKLLLLSKQLNISLDSLMSTGSKPHTLHLVQHHQCAFQTFYILQYARYSVAKGEA